MQEAADLLGTTVDGIRSRIKRGTLDSMKVGGQVYVLLDPDQSPPSPDQTRPVGASGDQSDRDALLSELRETVRDLRERLDREEEANRENRRIIAGLIERVPELEAPRNGQEDAQAPPEGVGDGEEPEKRSWWRRMFG